MGTRIGISSHRRIGFLYFFRAEFQGEKNGFPTHKEEITKAGLSFDRQYRQSSTERGEQARDKIVPTESLVKALQTAALAKVDVRLMIPERSDSTVLRFASFSYITEMLRAGVKVYFYQPGILHSKTIIIDDELCSVGSTNFDFRSFEHNFEANAFIYDREVNSEMKRIFLEDQQQCRRIIQHYWRHRPLYQKGIESIMRLLSPVL